MAAMVVVGMSLLSEVAAQRGQALVPRFGVWLQPVVDGLQRRRLELVEAFAPVTAHPYEAGVSGGRRDAWSPPGASSAAPPRAPGSRGTAVAEALEQHASGGIGDGDEDGIHVAGDDMQPTSCGVGGAKRSRRLDGLDVAPDAGWMHDTTHTIPARLAPFLAQWDYITGVLYEQLDGLTDEEFVWEPAAEVWNVRLVDGKPTPDAEVWPRLAAARRHERWPGRWVTWGTGSCSAPTGSWAATPSRVATSLGR